MSAPPIEAPYCFLSWSGTGLPLGKAAVGAKSAIKACGCQ